MRGNKFKLVLAVTVIMGMGGIVGQILLLREFLVAFYGNELIIGIIMANWLLLEGAGAFIAGRGKVSPVKLYPILLAVYALLLPLAIFFSRGIGTAFFQVLPGEIVETGQVFIATIILAGPVSMVHGALFPVSCKVLEVADRRSNIIGRVYLFETLGTLLGGFFFTLLLVQHFHSLEIALAILVLHFIAIAALVKMFAPFPQNVSSGVSAVILTVTVVIILLFSPMSEFLHVNSLSRQWPQDEILQYQNTPYGNIVLLQREGEYTFFYDGRPIISVPAPDRALINDFVHIVAASHSKPEDLLLIGSGLGGLLDEFLRHPLKEAVYIELDPILPEVVEKFPTDITKRELEDPRVHLKSTDGRLYLSRTDKKFDLIVMGFISPETLQTNRLFTVEFFQIASSRLADEGIIAFSLPGSAVYMGEELVDLNKSLFLSLEEAMLHVEVIPGDINIFLASNEPIKVDASLFSSRLDEWQIDRGFVSQEYLEYRLAPSRLQWVKDLLLESSATANYDFNPAGFFYSMSHWGRAFSPGMLNFFKVLQGITPVWYAVFLLFVTVVLMAIISYTRADYRGAFTYSLFTTGAAGMAFDLLILFVLQCLFGFVYQMAGLIVALFMGGIFLGARWSLRYSSSKNVFSLFVGIEVAVILLLFGLYGLAVYFQSFLAVHSHFIIFLPLAVFAVISGFAVGGQFPLAAAVWDRGNKGTSRIAANIYAADLFGGWLGGLFISIVLFPVLGLLSTVLLLVLLKLSSLMVLVIAGGGKGERGEVF